MSRNYSRTYSPDEQDMVDLENSAYQQAPIDFDYEIGGGGGGDTNQQQFQQSQQLSQNHNQRNSNEYVQNNQQEKQPYKNPYAASVNNFKNNQPTYYDVKSEQPVYVPPFLKENKPLRREKHKNVNDFLFWSVANIFLCVLFALPALFFSVQTRDNKKAGNQKKAKSYSKRALVLNILASTIGILTILLAILLRFALYHLVVQGDVNSMNVPLYQPYQPYKGTIN